MPRFKMKFVVPIEVGTAKERGEVPVTESGACAVVVLSNPKWQATQPIGHWPSTAAHACNASPVGIEKGGSLERPADGTSALPLQRNGDLGTSPFYGQQRAIMPAVSNCALSGGHDANVLCVANFSSSPYPP
jgi:hypothetical protein